jgi:hypothetical protein
MDLIRTIHEMEEKTGCTHFGPLFRSLARSGVGRVQGAPSRRLTHPDVHEKVYGYLRQRECFWLADPE